MNSVSCVTLAFNTPDQVTGAVERLYAQNKVDFTHYVFDLGFPLEEGDVIPEDIESAKKNNTEKLKKLCWLYGSHYLKIDNVGVQQNWSRAIDIIQPDDSDVIIGCDPDEVVLDNGWVNAMTRVCRNSNFALASLAQVGVIETIKEDFYTKELFNDIVVWRMKGVVNWAQIAFNGAFLNKINRELPYPPTATIYGHIEMMIQDFKDHGYDWAIIPDIKVEHTNIGKVYRAYKDYIIFSMEGKPQIYFDEYLQMKRSI